jgi:pilus assembly protein Flp/PilA
MNTLLMSVFMIVKSWFAEEEGQDLIEYALIIAVFVLVAVVGLSALGPLVQGMWSDIGTQLGG